MGSQQEVDFVSRHFRGDLQSSQTELTDRAHRAPSPYFGRLARLRAQKAADGNRRQTLLVKNQGGRSEESAASHELKAVTLVSFWSFLSLSDNEGHVCL